MRLEKKGLVLAALTAIVLVAGCSREGTEDVRIAAADHVGRKSISTVDDLKGRQCATIVGTAMDGVARAIQPDLRFRWFNDYNSATEALLLGKVEVFPIDEVIARQWVAHRPTELQIALTGGQNPYGYFFDKGSPLYDSVNGELRKMIADGTVRRLIDKWCDAPDLSTVTPEPLPPVPVSARKLRISSSCSEEPGSFVRDGRIVGFDIDILGLVAARIGRRLEIVQVPPSARIDAVKNGKADIGFGCITITEERKQSVDFTDCYYDGGFAMLVKRNDGRSEPERFSLSACVTSLKTSFVRTFVTEARWKLMASGLGVTLFVTFLATVLGTLLAFPLWLARTSRRAFVSGCAKGYISLLQGTPVLVLLMILFYLVFGKVDIDGVWVAVIGFALNFAAYFCEMLRSGIDSIPRGQTEAALALGYRPKKAFFRFVLPQAVRAILPVYRGEVISMLKATSIVGYIAINDLTKASDLVRSRTYESFFPILTTAFIYFVAAWVLAKVLDRLGRRLDPASRQRISKEKKPA